ncbi:MAG: hypothetical protein ACLR5G_00555 [Eubacteriales bacterium]
MRRNRGKDRLSPDGTGAAERLGSMVELYFYGRSDTGRVRNANQDSYIITRLVTTRRLRSCATAWAARRAETYERAVG